MNKSKVLFISVFALSIGFIGCQQNDNFIQSGETNQNKKVKSSTREAQTEFVKLTDESASVFLKNYASANNENHVRVATLYGDIVIKLYKNTPLHRANFLYLSNRNYYNDTWFYRVSKGHVIQAGNTDGAKTVRKREALGEYNVPNEMVEGNWHKRGAVAAARKYSKNPNKNSDPFEFYIVIGQSYSRKQLLLLAEKHEITLSDSQLDFYQDNPGSPHLDGEHTVFGEVISGMDVVMKISQVEVDEGEWPLKNIPITTIILPKDSVSN